MRLSLIFSVLVLSVVEVTTATLIPADKLYARRQEANERSALKRQEEPGQKLTFNNPKAQEFYVDGKSIPEVDFDVGPSYAGLLPISGNANETRKLFFWFFPPNEQGSADDLIYWTGGGPGCSALAGVMNKNGPFTWSQGTANPTPNPWSWTNFSSVLWVDQPIGTGFSEGEPNIKDENDAAAQVAGFMEQFLEVFSELKGKNLYLTGQSYAGTYIPYLANYIYDNPDKLDLKLKGTWMGSPLISSMHVQRQIPAMAYVHKFENVFALNQSAMASFEAKAAECGYTDFMEKHLKYPPTGPAPDLPVNATEGCDLWTEIWFAAATTNPAFNVYRIFDTWPLLWDVLKTSSEPSEDPLGPSYFNREDVKKVIHAPQDGEWKSCRGRFEVFPTDDASPPPVHEILPKVIEKSERTVIVQGLADYAIVPDGTRLAIQNMTWGGVQGFQEPIADDSFIVDSSVTYGFFSGAYGTSHTERGLSYIEMILTGHSAAQYSPWASFQTMQYLFGLRDTP